MITRAPKKKGTLVFIYGTSFLLYIYYIINFLKNQ